MTESSVAQAFDELRADDGYRVRAETFGAAFLPPHEHTVALIERVAHTRAPVLRRLLAMPNSSAAVLDGGWGAKFELTANVDGRRDRDSERLAGEAD